MKHAYRFRNLLPRLAGLLSLLALLVPAAQAQSALGLYYTQGSSTTALDALKSAPVAGGTGTSLASGSAHFAQPTDVVLDQANGYLYVADQYVSTGGIYRYKTDGTGRTLVVAGAAGTTYNGLAFDAAANKLYFSQAGATSTDAALKVVSLAGAPTFPITPTSLLSLSGRVRRPGDLALDAAAGVLYLADQYQGTGNIFKVVLSTGILSVPVAATPGASYAGLALDAAGGRLYFTQGSPDPTLDALKVVTLSTGAITTLASGSANFAQPSDLAFAPGASGSAGQLYLTDQYVGTGAVLRYTLSAAGGVLSAGSRTVLVAPTAGAAYGGLTLALSTAPLPVTLVSFTAERVGADGQLAWATASELRNDYFEVESSTDGTAFQSLGRVAGHGSSAQGYRYQYTDANLARYAAGLVYYRLRQVDTDGTGTYSPVRPVAVPLETGLLAQVYPNPSVPGSTVVLSIRTSQAGLVSIRFTDVLGREVGQQQADLPGGATTLPLPGTSQLAAGVYLLRVQQGNYQQTLKLVRQD